LRHWLNDNLGLTARPFLYIEDDIQDVRFFCDAVSKAETYPGELLEACTILVLDKAGPGTEKTVVELLSTYPALQIVAGPFNPPLNERLIDRLPAGEATRSDPFGAGLRLREFDLEARFCDLSPDELSSAREFEACVDRLLRPRGCVLCDINLPPLTFPNPRPDQIDAQLKGPCAAGVACKTQGEKFEELPVQQVATLCLLSGIAVHVDSDRDLAGIGIPLAPRPTFRKTLQNRVAVATMIRRFLADSFPLSLEARVGESGKRVIHRVGPADAAIINKVLDLVCWPLQKGSHALSGKLVQPEKELDGDRVGVHVLERLLERYLGPHHELSDTVIQDLAKKYQPQSPKRDVQNPAQVVSTLKDNFLDASRDDVIPPKNLVKKTYKLGDSILAGIVRAPSPKRREVKMDDRSNRLDSDAS
jgi:hypothetical protein